MIKVQHIHFALPNIFSLKEMISTALLRADINYYNQTYHLDSFNGGENEIECVRKLFCP